MKFLFIITLALISCKNSSSPTYDHLTDAEKVVINFNAPNSDTIVKTVTTSEYKAIKKLAGFIDSKASPAYKCGYDGNILFYEDDVLLADVAFNYSEEGCRHFIQIISEQVSSTRMSNEAADFLRSLAEGRSWY